MEKIIESAAPNRKIHPHKMVLYIAMGSIIMTFAGFTSAYIVQKAGSEWILFKLPPIFWFSTAVILLSSVTMQLGLSAFKKRAMPRYRLLITTTLILGILFAVLQSVGFMQLYGMNIKVNGRPNESFIFIIPGLHLVHILGGIIALLIVFFRAFRTNLKVYNATGLEIVATYWHFVDALWIYLFVFFLANQ